MARCPNWPNDVQGHKAEIVEGLCRVDGGPCSLQYWDERGMEVPTWFIRQQVKRMTRLVG
jgi:hypothetical protein